MSIVMALTRDVRVMISGATVLVGVAFAISKQSAPLGTVWVLFGGGLAVCGLYGIWLAWQDIAANGPETIDDVRSDDSDVGPTSDRFLANIGRNDIRLPGVFLIIAAIGLFGPGQMRMDGYAILAAGVGGFILTAAWKWR